MEPRGAAMADAQRVCLITGAGRATGLGFEVARQLAAAGRSVVLTARRPEAAAARAADLAAHGLEVLACPLDVDDASSIAQAAALVAERHGRLDVLINNAAATSVFGETAAGADLESARRTVETILFGTWRVSQTFLPLLMESANGVIVNVTSGAGSHADPVFGLSSGNAMPASYGVAKAAANALTALFAREAPGLRVNAVCPGFTDTFEGGAAMGARPVAESAKGVVWAAKLGPDGPTGGFFRDGRPLGW